MDDREALTRAVAADPDDDLPRLVFADWLDEHGEADFAAFVRAQVELANTPAWEPFAVRCRHFQAEEWVRGTPFRHHLPDLPRGLEWHPEAAFRRGFAWALVVRDLEDFFAAAPRLFDTSPLGRLHLPNGTLDDWRRLARQPWLPGVKAVHFYAMSPPTEAVRELCDSALATGIEEVVFEASSNSAMLFVVERLMRSPLGRRLRRLELRVGPDILEDADELYRAVASAEAVRLESFALVTSSRGDQGLQDLYAAPVLEQLTQLELVNVRGVWLPSYGGWLPRLSRIRAAACGISSRNVETFLGTGKTGSSRDLRALDLSDNPIEYWPFGGLIPHVALDDLSRLRSLNLRRTALGDDSVRHWLTRAPFWPNLVELDLRNNPVTDDGARALLDAPVPAELTALRLGGTRIGDSMCDRLRDHFGDAVSFEEEETGNGLR